MKKGTVYILCCYILWGLLPIYWKQLAMVDSLFVLSSRILWSFVFCGIIIILKGELKNVQAALKDRSMSRNLLIAGIMVSLNWGLYIIAVNSGHIVEASLAYYMNPIISIVIGFIFFSERLSRVQWISVVVAFLGVGYSVIAYGKIPIFALAIAGSFSIYGALKKKISCKNEVGLFVETMYVLPIALVYMFWKLKFSQVGIIYPEGWRIIYLPLSGAITSIPLLLFAEGMKTTSLTTSGILMYFNPTLQLLVGVLLYAEDFTIENLITFIFVWTAIAIYLPTVIKKKDKMEKLNA